MITLTIIDRFSKCFQQSNHVKCGTKCFVVRFSYGTSETAFLSHNVGVHVKFELLNHKSSAVVYIPPEVETK